MSPVSIIVAFCRRNAAWTCSCWSWSCKVPSKGNDEKSYNICEGWSFWSWSEVSLTLSGCALGKVWHSPKHSSKPIQTTFCLCIYYVQMIAPNRSTLFNTSFTWNHQSCWCQNNFSFILNIYVPYLLPCYYSGSKVHEMWSHHVDKSKKQEIALGSFCPFLCRIPQTHPAVCIQAFRRTRVSTLHINKARQLKYYWKCCGCSSNVGVRPGISCTLILECGSEKHWKCCVYHIFA